MTMAELVEKQDLDFRCSDKGNAARLVEEYGNNFRYCNPLGGWLAWNGVR